MYVFMPQKWQKMSKNVSLKFLIFRGVQSMQKHSGISSPGDDDNTINLSPVNNNRSTSMDHANNTSPNHWNTNNSTNSVGPLAGSPSNQ